MKEIFAFVCEPVVDDPESDWVAYISSDRNKLLEFLEKRKERLNIEFYEVELSDYEEMSQYNFCFSFDEMGKPAKLYVDDKREMGENDVPCFLYTI